MATPWECNAVPISVGVAPDALCNPPAADPAPVAVPAPVPGAPAPPPAPVVTVGMVSQAMRQVELPASQLVVQPPNGRTLVNFETNFYTERGDFVRTVNLLGQQVDLRISAAAYVWRFGDGAELSTASAGAPYPSLDVTHRYVSRGEVAPSVDTVYVADYRVGGGPWAPVPGSVTVAGPAEALEVVTARPVLVG